MIKIITDSAADLPGYLLTEKHIDIARLEVRLGSHDKELLSAMDGKQFWEIVQNTDGVPQTSAPSPGTFAELFTAAKEEGYDGALCITLASGFSSTYEAALVGAKTVEDFPIEIIDSKSVTLGEGLLVLFASKLAESGAKLPEIVDQVCQKRDKIKILAVLDTLEYLKLGGRIGPLSSMIGSLLSVKPIIEIKSSEIIPVSKQRTRSKAVDFLVDLLKNTKNIEQVAVVHSEAPDIERVLDMISPVTNGDNTLVSYIGPVIGAYSGPGTIGFCIIEK